MSGPYTVTIPAKQTYFELNVTIFGDSKLEKDENFDLDITSSSLPDRVTLGSPRTTRIVIVNDDGKGVMIPNTSFPKYS